jgi:hypothetical protein
MRAEEESDGSFLPGRVRVVRASKQYAVKKRRRVIDRECSEETNFKKKSKA